MAGLGWLWILSGTIVLGIVIVVIAPGDFFLSSGDWWDDFDAPITDWFVSMRTDAFTDVALALDALRTEWFLTVLRWGTVVLLLIFARWRHLFAFVFVILGIELVVVSLANAMSRPRPDGVEILTDWSGFAAPSLPAAAVAVTLVAMVYALAVPGKWRHRSLVGITVLIIGFAVARTYLAVERATDVASGEIMAVAAAVLIFRFVTPDAVFPVSYSRGKTAHLDMTDARVAAIKTALRDQLGIEVAQIELFGLEGSGGSTPLRLTLSGGGYLFGKVYAKNHLRSDRWYKLGRTILYGALEDESSYRTVRRLAEHEDHVMRLMADAGVAVPEPLGIAELTPGREYMIVTEFLEGVSEMSDADVDESTVDSAMWTVAKMWNGGLAHRDIKPANVLVGNDGAALIDHAFGEIRPSPWRQAIDLANMMLSLSPHLPSEEIYARAREHFTDDELAEAFAATHSVTIPGELRATVKGLDHDPIQEFRDLAPQRAPISIQRWTRRRIGAIVGLVLVAGLVVWMLWFNQSIVSGLL